MNKENKINPQENSTEKITDIAVEREKAADNEFIKSNIKGFDNIKPDDTLPEQVSSKIISDTSSAPLQEVKKKKHKKLKMIIGIAACLCAVLLVATAFLQPLRSIIDGSGMFFSLKSSATADSVIGDTNGVKLPDKAIKGEIAAGSVEKAPEIADGKIDIVTDADTPTTIDGTFDGDGEVDTAANPDANNNEQEGSLTAGEWNDNENWDFFKKVIKSNQDFVSYQKSFSIYPSERVAVTVNTSGKPVVNATVMGYASNGDLIWSAVTDNNGKAYLFPNLFNQKSQDSISSVKVVSGNAETTVKTEGKKELEVDLENAETVKKALDLMFVIDTTGSMSDELSYLQWELQNIVNSVKNDNPDITIRLSINFYRDEGDEYVVKANPFSTDIENTIKNFSSEEADGGGDYEEAVDQAVANAINEHEWDESSYARLMFLILDAPPHETKEIVESMNNSVKTAAEKGIRIISVAASGINKRTEMMLRSFAVVTGGTYTFLTDDSGIGDSHIEPTIGDYEVKPFKQIITDVINGYLK